MLCQLVCVDRRYQRMNCFNIREIQSILKRKFFTDLINSHDHHTLLDKTAMGLRFKTNNINSINSNIFVFYNYGIEFTPKIRTSSYFFSNEFSKSNINSFNNQSIFFKLISFFSDFNYFNFLNSFYFSIIFSVSCLTGLEMNFKSIAHLLTSAFFDLYDYTYTFLEVSYNTVLATILIITSFFNNMQDFIFLFFT